MGDFCMKRGFCYRCDQRYKYENLSLCIRYDKTYCPSCRWKFEKVANGNHRCDGSSKQGKQHFRPCHWAQPVIVLQALINALESTPVPAPDSATTKRLLRSMLLIRKVEEHICQVYHTDAVKSPVHLSIGQESVAVGICDPLLADDMVSNTYRCHATYIAKGGDVRQMMAELYGKVTGCAAGKAGSMHLIDMPHGVMGASAVVGTTIPVAAGYALAMLRDAPKTGKQRVVVSVFGDGATEEGSFAETLHFATLHKLPMIFVCENNKLAIHSNLSQRWPGESLLRDRARAYGLPVHHINDGDVFTIRGVILQACADIRAKKSGPVFLECATYRWLEHVGPADDHNSGYRDQKEYARWKENDQIARLEKMLSAQEVEQIHTEVKVQLEDAVTFAKESPYPSPEQLNTCVYAA